MGARIGFVVCAALTACGSETPTTAQPQAPVRALDAATVAVTPDADLAAEAQAVADLLTADNDGPGPQVGDMNRRRPAAGVGDGTKRTVDGPPAPPPTGPQGRVSVSDKQALDTSTLTVDTVLAKILAAYMAGLKRCYKEELKKNPSLEGKIAMTFTVIETGRATAPTATGDLPTVSSCVANQMSSWRFPIPKDTDGDAITARFSLKFTFVPN